MTHPIEQRNKLVEFNKVSKKFYTKNIVENVSFSLREGLITTLIGQNGAGKTTIARMVLGLEKPNSGKIDVKANITMGYVPQKLDYYKALPMVANSLLLMIAPNYDKNSLEYLDQVFKFKQLLNQDLADLSGGQLQKMMLVAAILSKPDLLILDEPTQYLDVSSQQQFYRILDWVKKTQNTSIFIISHDLFAVMKNSDEVICINEHICCSGKPNTIQSNPALAKVIGNIKMSRGDLETNAESQTKDQKESNDDMEIGVYIHEHDHHH